MFSKCEIRNRDGVTVYSLDSAPNAAGFSALKTFDPHVEQRAITDRNKAQAHGVWPTLTYRGGMTIDMTGTFQANLNAPANVLTQIALCSQALFGLPTDAVSVRYDCILRIRKLDSTEDWQTNCAALAFTAPATAESTIVEWMITLFSFTPWFTGVSTSGLYYYT